MTSTTRSIKRDTNRITWKSFSQPLWEKDGFSRRGYTNIYPSRLDELNEEEVQLVEKHHLLLWDDWNGDERPLAVNAFGKKWNFAKKLKSITISQGIICNADIDIMHLENEIHVQNIALQKICATLSSIPE